ncbi:3-phosphoserine/phosphohydroxythreonine transaminase [Rubrivirga sp. S365]|uniref:Phosphoserine aminotransferase n=1 Tax=Rubrivirga litoralis TaxID=3075598 RepID=A0ABU3BRF4_9BACT|nr:MULTISPECIES: 3-phosphoserine/phosphohydroxythreonine transaminase [unclassified Rubrivirga]MDT0631872.1 3-phosphoserine/phosphohydroxythreonine transaminase [Rubrivirga sp. F394]MDT7857925.1 3-phosphoserine/phosphohydroxythreonine transaminase [Rubrivirga sp. S365]
MMQPVSYEDAPADLDQRQHNFSAGPGALPTEVLEEVRAELPVYPGVGASVMEISHRSPAYSEIHERAASRMRGLLGMGDDWHVLFLQGGASMQFHQVPLNFLPDDGSADYIDTGAWSAKAIKEAEIVGAGRNAGPRVAASSRDDDYTYIPGADAWDLNDGAAYLHFTSNNTIYGTQFAAEPEAAAPLVCDASSDFLSRPLDVDRYGLIYAGAQKNIGPAGVTAVLVRDDFLERRHADLPTMLDYGTHAAKIFNTPPVFAVYLVDKVLGWIEANGGLAGMVERNQGKADALYGAIDASDFYRGTVRPDSRSQMNVCFRLPSEELEARFVKEAKGAGLLALKGHRSVGGVRASIYNAIEPASVTALVDFMGRFEAANG